MPVSWDPNRHLPHPLFKHLPCHLQEQVCKWQNLVTGHFVAENTTRWAAATSDQWDLTIFKVQLQPPTFLRPRILGF